MDLGAALSSAGSGLDSINRQLAIISQNVANASTPNYVEESVPLTSEATGDLAYGVATGPATRAMDQPLQNDLFAAYGNESGDQVTQSALATIDQVSGSPGSGQDLSSLFGALRDGFSTLEEDPSNASQQNAALDAAQNLAGGLHSVSTALLSARQSAQDSLTQGVTDANTALQAVGALSDQIIAAKSRGQSTADLEDKRDGEEQTVAQLTGAQFIPQNNGDVLAVVGGSVLNTRASTGPFSVGAVTLAASTPQSAIPPLQLNGQPVTGIGGSIGAEVTLRDSTLPTLQGNLDSFSQSLAAQFSGQGLNLFTDPLGVVPPVGTAGFSATIQVSAAVTATPTMLRDGSLPATTAGNTTLIDNVLTNVFASSATSLSGQATNLVAGYASMASQAASQADTSTAVRTSLQNKLSGETGVSVDAEMTNMVKLQNAYEANARVIGAVQSMWTSLLSAVQ